MKIIFFGSGNFAVSVLKAMHAGGPQSVCLVVTQPDRKKGRHLHLTPTPVKEYALSHELKLFQPEDINGPASIEALKNERADVFVVVSYGRILSKEVLKVPRRMCVNIHASLLPKFRGAAPIARALMNGEQKTGVTFIKMNEKMDQGEVIFKKMIQVDKKDDVISLDKKLSELAAGHIVRILENIESGRIKLKKQNGKRATYAPLLVRQDGLVHWDSTPREILDRYRGCFGWPGSFTTYRGKLLKVFNMAVGRRKNAGRPGEIVRAEDNILEVACKNGTILIGEVLPESHNRMVVKSFLSGHQVKAGEFLGA